MVSKLTLFQYEICPFCSKVKGLLDFYRVPYNTVEVNPLTKAQLNRLDFRQKKVPFAIFPDGARVAESSVILQGLRDRGYLEHGKVSQSEWQKWEKFADKKLSVLLFPNITRSLKESWQAFSYIQDAPGFSSFDKIVNRSLGSVAMFAANSKLKKKYGISDERAELEAVINEWTASFSGEYYGGQFPNEVDALIFGVLRAVEGLDVHLWLLSRPNAVFSDWYAAMSSLVGPRHSSRNQRL